MSLTIDQNTNTFTIIPDSSLPANETITFTVAHISIFKGVPQLFLAPTYSPPQSYDNIVTFDGGLGGMTLDSTVNSQETFTCDGNV